MPVRSRNKYGAKKTVIDGIKFDSIREGQRYVALKSLLRAGLIDNLRVKVKYNLEVNGVKIGRYTSDFNYTENGREVVEDSKGHRTRDYILRRKLMLAIHGIEIRET